MKSTNNKGPKTEPWGTPDKTAFFSENLPLTDTRKVLLVRKSLI